MILLLSFVLSITMISLSLVRKYSKQNKQEIMTEDMNIYYDTLVKGNQQNSYKQLVVCCNNLLTNINILEKKKEVVDPLYKGRLVSEEMYDSMNSELKSMSIQKMIIESEAKQYNRNIFKECRGLKNIPVEKCYKIVEDIHFDKKREALEMELCKRLTNKV
jgi:hypothetical protein